jgi:catechol 2,3-dioxygenase-like lactoylglutathione lyase family enzyme
VTGLGEIALFTDDVEGVAAFYVALTGAAPVAEWPGGALFAVGEAKLLVHERAAALAGGPPNEDHFAIAVADLDGACTALAARGTDLLVEPREYPWGRSAYLRDPDGRLVELVQA